MESATAFSDNILKLCVCMFTFNACTITMIIMTIYADSLDAGRRRLSTTEMKKTTQRGAELSSLLPMPEPVSPAGKAKL